MKKIVLLIILSVGPLILAAQSPHSFRYQTVVRDNSGEILSNKNIGIKISLLQNSPAGIVVYSESFNPITSSLGLINLSVGTGNALLGSINAINWSEGPYFMRIDIDKNGGNDFEFLGTSQLLSVPYALYAETAGNGSNQSELYWKRNGNNLYYNDGNIGIGTINPIGKLNIVGTVEEGDERAFIRLKNYAKGPRATVSIALQSFEDKGAAFGYCSSNYSMNDLSDFGVFTTNGRGFALVAYNGQIRFYTNKNSDNSYSEKMRINEEGNVGIGTASPSSMLNIVGTVYSGRERNLLQLQNTTEDAFSYTGLLLTTGKSVGHSVIQDYGLTYTASTNYDFAGFLNVGNSSRGVMLSAGAADGVIKFYTGYDDFNRGSIERMRIDADGNVGIGTNAPSAKFEIADGDIFISDINKGIIMTSPNGQCWRGTVNNSGLLTFTPVTCP